MGEFSLVSTPPITTLIKLGEEAITRSGVIWEKQPNTQLTIF